MFPEITIHKISETNSNFHVTCRSTDGKSLISIFREHFANINKLSFWLVDWALGYHSMEFRHFPYIS